MDEQKELAKHTKQYRIDHGLTQLGLAVLMRVSEATVWRIEQAKSVSIPTAYLVRKFLENSQ